MNPRHIARRHSLLELIAVFVFVFVVVVGAIIAIVDTDDMPAVSWLTLVALAAVPAGLVAIGEGIAEAGRHRAAASTLELAYIRGETYREPRVS